MSHLGLQILYFMLNSREDTYCERAFAPWGDPADPAPNFSKASYLLKEYMCLDFTMWNIPATG